MMPGSTPLIGAASMPAVTGDAQPTSGLITVIMPCYNAASTIEESIRCVLGQSHANTELIVVDDGSTDDSLRLIEALRVAHPDRVRLLQQDHKGPYPARNLALAEARGECIAFLDADDTWTPDCLARLLDTLRAAEADIAYCGWQNTGPAAISTQPFVPPAYEAGDLFAECLRSCPWPIHAALVRRTAIAAVGGFSERMFTSMDFDLWLRLLAHTQRIVRVPAVMAFYYWHGQQISTDKSRQIIDAVQVRKDFIAHHPLRVAHLDAAQLLGLTDGFLLQMAYRALWRRESATAHRLFRVARQGRAWGLRDLAYLCLARLPLNWFSALLRWRDGTTLRG